MSHALLSPSAAHRWLHCTAAPMLEAKVPDEGTDFAREGTLAHAMAALALKGYLCRDTTAEALEIEELAEYKTDEMRECVADYYGLVMGKFHEAKAQTPDAVLIIERKVDASEWAEGVTGTADAIIIADGVIEIIDLKYGKGVKVEAEENPQMMIYALGALSRYDMEYDLHAVRMTIAQPRLSSVSTWETSVDNLIEWACDVLKPKAAEAASGNGRHEAGEWCRFCKVKSTCRALADYCTAPFELHPDTSELTPAEIAVDILPRLATIKQWCTMMEEHALKLALEGTRLPGYKIVEGRSVRRITDADELRRILTEAGFTAKDFDRPTELKTLTDLEKTVGKKRFAELAGALVEKPEGKPTLAPEDDRRSVFNPAANFETI